MIIGILDYKNCSILPIYYSIKSHNVKVKIIEKPNELKDVDKLVFPGVGATNQIMSYLVQNNFIDEIKNFANLQKKILGICAGMQILGKKLNENNNHYGLDFFESEVLPIDKNIYLKSTNIGWINVKTKKDNQSYYFCHSFYMKFYDEKDESIIGHIDLIKKIPAIIKRGNIIGVQFHPEKSQSNGRSLIADFLYDRI